MTRTTDKPTSRRQLLATLGKGAAAAVVLAPAAIVAAEADPIIAKVAEALRLCTAATAACSAYAKAADALQLAGYPTAKPAPVSLPMSENEETAELLRTALDHLNPKPAKRREYEARLRKVAPLAEADRIEREARERAETEAAVAKWQEGEARFGIAAATAEIERATEAQLAAVEVVADMPIMSVEGALAVFALAHWHVADHDEEGAADLLAKGQAWIDAAAILPPALRITAA